MSKSSKKKPEKPVQKGPIAVERTDAASFSAELKKLLNECKLSPGTLSGVLVEDFAIGIKKDLKTAKHYLSGATVPNERDFRKLEIFLAKVHPKYPDVRERFRDAYSRSKHPSKTRKAASAGSVPGTESRSSGSSLKGVPETNFRIIVPRPFVGRQHILEMIREVFAARSDRLAVAVLYGMPGLGKTAVANAYADEHAENYRAIWQIDAHTPQTMRAALIDLGVRLKWIKESERENDSVNSVLNFLRHEGDSLLLIYENAPDPNSLKLYLPPSGTASVLVTTNNYECRSIGTPIELNLWPKEVGASFLIQRSGRLNENRESAENLSRLLGGLPLAHEQAGAYCEQRTQISLSEYAVLFEAEPIKHLEDVRFAPVDYGKTVAKTFSLAIDAAEKRTSGSKVLISLISSLALAPVPVDLFSGAHGFTLSHGLVGENLEDAIASLRAFALLSRGAVPDERFPTFVTDCVWVHRLVREVALSDFAAEFEEAHAVFLVFMAYDVASYKAIDQSAWPRLRRLEPHAWLLASSPIVDVKQLAVESCILLNGLATYYQKSQRKYEVACSIFQKCVELARAPDVPARHLATIVNNFGLALADAEYLQPSIEMLSLALRMRRQLNEWPEDIANTLNNIGITYAKLKLHHEALEAYCKAIKIIKKIHGRYYFETGSCLNNIASTLMSMDRLSEAERFLRLSLKVHTRVDTQDHLRTAAVHSNLGLVLEWQDRIAAAIFHFESAFMASEKVLGTEDKVVVELREKIEFLRKAQNPHPPK